MRLRLLGREDLCPLPHMPGFVPTRGGMLYLWAKRLVSLRVALQVAWSPEAFGVHADISRVLHDLASTSLAADVFWARTAFLARFSAPLETCRTWGNGCVRHDAERREGRSVACVLAGRRLRWAWSRAQDLVQELTRAMLWLAAIPEADAAMGL